MQGVSYRCYNKSPQIEWLKTTQSYYLTVLQLRHTEGSHLVKIKVSEGLCSFLEVLGENLFSYLFQSLGAACNPGLMAPYLVQH
mgnify:CR=1 FL=1